MFIAGSIISGAAAGFVKALAEKQQAAECGAPVARPYRVTLFSAYQRPQIVDAGVLWAYDLNDAWAAAARKHATSDTVHVHDIRPENMPTAFAPSDHVAENQRIE